MDSKPLAFGIIGFLLGGLIVSLAAAQNEASTVSGSEMTMTQMTENLRDKTGSAYDAAFLTEMIDHHQAALDMAKLSEGRAEHAEVKELSKNIITAQEQEIARMKQWQTAWGLADKAAPSMDMR